MSTVNPLYGYVNGFPIVLNQSSWKDYVDCPRLYAWKRIEGLSPNKPQKALHVGTASHTALNLISTGAGVDDAVQAAVAQFRTLMGKPMLPGDFDDIGDGVDILERMIPAYVDHWGQSGQIWTPLGKEVAFFVEVGEGTGVFLRGRADNLVMFKGGLWLGDYKTMAKLDLRDFSKYEMDIQVTAYIYGLTKALTMEALSRGAKPVIVHGLMIDALVKTKTPQFHREVYSRTFAELEEFEREFVEWGRRIAISHQRVEEGGEAWKTVFPKNTNQCFRYGTCPYRELCLADTPMRRKLYSVRTPDYVDDAQRKLNGETNADPLDPTRAPAVYEVPGHVGTASSGNEDVHSLPVGGTQEA